MVRSMPKRGGLFLTLLLLSTGSSGCQSILGIEQVGVVERDACTEGSCANVSCTDDADCGHTYRCRNGRCQSLDSAIPPGPEGGMRDAGMDTGLPPMDGGDDAGVCVEGALRCDAKAGVVRSQCRRRTWESAEPCGEDLLCDSEGAMPGECKPAIAACLGRKPLQPFCVGKERTVCGADLVSKKSTTCKSSEHCTEATGDACADCTRSEARCEGDKLLACNADRDGFAEVESCKPGECNAQLGRCTKLVCQPNAFDCVENAVMQCNGDGTANTTIKECGSATCDKANKRCNMCQPNQVLGCDVAGAQQVCAADGQSVLTRTCASLDPSKPVCTGLGLCVACKPSSSECKDPTTLVSCSGQGVASSSQCSGTTCVVDQCAGECAPSQLSCMGMASPARNVCGVDGMFRSTASCPSGTLCDTTSSPAGVCRAIVAGCSGKQPGEASCDGATRVVCGKDLVTTTSSKLCASSAYCQQGTGSECATCITNEHACSGAQLRICNAAHTGFVDKETCTSAALCNKETGKCSMATCDPGAWTCNGNTLRHCNASGTDYITSDTKTCGAGLCNAGAQRCNVCEPNKIRCLEEGGKGRVQCAADGSGEVSIAACGNACLGGSCVACAPAAAFCVDSKSLNTCDASGAWTITTDCSAMSQTCTGGACTGDCAANTYQCISRTASQKCDGSGKWNNDDTCTTSPAEVCDLTSGSATYGKCVANDPVPLGSNAASGGARTLYNDGLYAQPVIPTVDVRLIGFGITTTNESVGGTVFLSLHGDSNNQPGNIINRTNAFSLGQGQHIRAPITTQSTNIQMTAGTRYWVVAKMQVVDAQAPQVYLNPSSPAGAFRFGTQTYGIPGNLTAGQTTLSSGALTLFVQVQK